MDLIQLVSYTDNNKMRINGMAIKWDRGQYPISRSFLSMRWSWSESKVARFLNELKIEQMVELKSDGKATILTLCNYDTYNVSRTGDDTGDERVNGQLTNVNKEDNIEDIKEDKVNNTPPTPSLKIDYQFIIDNYHTLCPLMGKVIRLNDFRKGLINARIGEYGLEKVISVLRMAGESDFLNGRNDKAWKADFEWIFRPQNFLKIYEGKYQNKKIRLAV